MLQTQVAYWTLQESKRHNIVSESQNAKDLARRERELRQTINFNKEQVSYWRDQLSELSRHNKVTEKLSTKELKVKRDQAKASLKQAKAALQQAETARRELGIKAQQANASMIQAGAAQQQASAAHKQADVASRNASINAFDAGTRRYSANVTAAKTKAETGLVKRQAKTEKKRTKWYTTEKVIIPGVNAFANLVKSGASAFKSVRGK